MIQRTVTSLALLASATLPAAAQSALYTLEGNTGDQLGRGLCFVPDVDVDGDGVDDFAIGAPGEDPGGNGMPGGSVFVVSGKTSSMLWQNFGGVWKRELGAALAAVPDVDGDGKWDVLAGAPNRSWAVGYPGRAFVFSSASGATLRTFDGTGPNDEFGASVARLGDVDGDGFEDFAVGAPHADVGGVACGVVAVYSGANGLPMHTWSPSASSPMRFGATIADAGDLDRDGRADVLIGAPEATIGGLASCGAAYLCLSTSATPQVIAGSSAGEQFGSALTSLGDLDGDARPELAIGAPLANAGGTSRGRVVVLDGATRAVEYELTGFDGWQFGSALARSGDFDGDGLADFAAGAPWYSRPGLPELGLVRIHASQTGALVKTLYGFAGGSLYGSRIDGSHDLNGDARGELLVGAISDNSFTGGGGGAHLLLSNAPLPKVYGTPKTNSAGCVPHIECEGAASTSLGRLRIRATSVLESKPGMLLWGLSSASQPFHGGTLLVEAPIVRTPMQVAGASATPCGGTLSFYFDPALFGAYGLAAGTPVCAQWWSRDPGFAAPDSVGLSDGLRFVVAP
jgi:hypothetical protein